MNSHLYLNFTNYGLLPKGDALRERSEARVFSQGETQSCERASLRITNYELVLERCRKAACHKVASPSREAMIRKKVKNAKDAVINFTGI